jgi:uncharacterized protein
MEQKTPVQSRDELLSRLEPYYGELEQLGVRTLALFGSFARGDHGPTSDVDFLIGFVLGPRLFDRYMDTQSLLADILGRDVHLSTIDNMNMNIYFDYIEMDVFEVIGEVPHIREAV